MFTKRVADLEPGDMIDLFGDRFADPNRDPSLAFEFEYQPVYALDREADDCIAVYCDNFACGFPPDHLIPTVLARN